MDNNCVLVKKKEYEELMKQAASKKPDYISIDIRGMYCQFSGKEQEIRSSINLSDGIVNQIGSIRSKIRSVNEDNVKYIREQYNKLESEYHEFLRMSFWQRIRWTFTKKKKVK